MKKLKKVKKSDIGYGLKKLALNDMKKDNTLFDDLDGYFGNPDVDSKIVEDFLKKDLTCI